MGGAAPQGRVTSCPAALPAKGLCLTGLIALRCTPFTSLIFPSVIGILMVIRVKLIPRMFSRRELRLLDTAIGSTRV